MDGVRCQDCRREKVFVSGIAACPGCDLVADWPNNPYPELRAAEPAPARRRRFRAGRQR